MLLEIIFPPLKLAAMHGEVACEVESRVIVDHLFCSDIPDPISRKRFLADWTGISGILHFLVAVLAYQMTVAALIDGSVAWNHEANWAGQDLLQFIHLLWGKRQEL